MTALPHRSADVFVTGTAVHTREYQAYRLLQLAFVAAPIVLGIDKFFDAMGNWDKYLYPAIASAVHLRPHQFMMIVGVIEIAAGIGVALKPRYFAYVVVGWLVGIILNLLAITLVNRELYFDVAARDLGLCIAALALGRLANDYDVGMLGGLFVRRRTAKTAPSA
jgi:hypothetical protein